MGTESGFLAHNYTLQRRFSNSKKTILAFRNFGRPTSTFDNMVLILKHQPGKERETLRVRREEQTPPFVIWHRGWRSQANGVLRGSLARRSHLTTRSMAEGDSFSTQCVCYPSSARLCTKIVDKASNKVLLGLKSHNQAFYAITVPLPIYCKTKLRPLHR
eukprot:scaffold649_cov347-Pavlova_lutheri.AAC.83